LKRQVVLPELDRLVVAKRLVGCSGGALGGVGQARCLGDGDAHRRPAIIGVITPPICMGKGIPGTGGAVEVREFGECRDVTTTKAKAGISEETAVE
jgi:hypothetical protein